MTRKELLDQIEKNVNVCRKCRLYKDATNAVPGEGNIHTEIVFIGEAPGKNEDLLGRPFVGRAGKLLEASLERIGLKRKDVWIGNIIKHRPPDNRDPLPDEIKACEKYLEYQLKAIKPILIVTLGRFSMNYFFADGKISKDRGRLIKIDGYNVFPIYHPAAALRNSAMKAGFDEDFDQIPNVLKEIKNLNEKANESKSDILDKDDDQLGLDL